MAIPTITSITPSSGSTRGQNVVRIEGTGYRLPDPPPATGPVLADQQKTVSVQFEGIESEWAYSAHDGLILARVPEWEGPYDVLPAQLDVRVANLDNSGVEIPGENVTAADAYGIDRPSLVVESYLQRTVREVIRLFRRHVLQNTHHTTQRDYSLTPAQQETLRAEGPLVQLAGPRLVLNRFHSIEREEDESDPLGGVDGRMRRKPPVTVNIEFNVVAWANNPMHLHGLVQALLLLQRDVKLVKVPRDPSNPGAGTKDYEFRMDWGAYPDITSDPSTDDLMYASTTFFVRGVHLDEDVGTIVERGWIITQNNGDPVLQVQVP